MSDLAIQAPAWVHKMVARGAIFYISHSGGKDSQAMYALISEVVPHEQISVIHADLGEIEWDGVQDHIIKNIDHPLNVVRAGKTFFDMVRHRAKTRPDVPAWPSSAARQCTSDLKRGPIQKFIRNDLKTRGKTLAVNCVGLRAEESPSRKKRKSISQNKALSVAGRDVSDYLLIQHLSESEVFEVIKKAGQQPFWAYSEGNKRLSCVFCIMGCDGDLRHGAKARPNLYRKYLDLERETGWSMFNGQSLKDHVEGLPKTETVEQGRLDL